MSFYHKLVETLFDAESDSSDFTPQFRLEGKARNPNNTDALAMRTADPLWMLGRQWQFGEFIGEDNGSPVSAKAHYRKKQPQYYSSFKGDGQHRINNVPLEASVEAVTINTLDLKSKVRIGKQFEGLIREQFKKADANRLINNLRAEFPLTHELRQDNKNSSDMLDEKSRRFFRLMQGKVIDGGALLKNIKNKTYPKQSTTNRNFAELANVSSELREWYRNLFVQETKNEECWLSNYLSHNFKLHWQSTNKKEKFNLSSPDYQSGHLDWYSFDSFDGAGFTIDLANTEASKDYQPVNVSFPSMPDKRLFSFEDSQIDLSMMDVEPADLLKLMLLDFSLVSGSDWYTIPLEMKPGELCWIDKIEVKDVFGVTTTIENDGKKGAILDANPLKVWDVFKIRNHQPSAYKKEEHFLFLPPATSFRMESEPIEELQFFRDEYANMVWALENKVVNTLGNSVDGHDLHLELYGPTKSVDHEAEDSQLPIYRLSNTLPSNWIPYLPKHIDNDIHNIELERVKMMRNETDEEPTDIEPLTFLAAENNNIREEAIPKAGVRVQLTKQRVRWTDGKTYVWMGRKVLAGRGETNSGLRFDYLIDEE